MPGLTEHQIPPRTPPSRLRNDDGCHEEDREYSGPGQHHDVGPNLEEPNDYFVMDGRLTRHSEPPTEVQVKYRSVLKLAGVIARSAAFMDGVQQEIVFFRDGRIVVPVDYDTGDIGSLKIKDVERLAALFDDPIHLDQKLTMLSKACIDAAAGLPAGQRFRQLMREAGDIADKVEADIGCSRPASPIPRSSARLRRHRPSS